MADVGIGTTQKYGSSGLPPKPYVKTAVAQSNTIVRVSFDQRMKASNPGAPDDTLNLSNYTFDTTLGVPRSAQSVSLVSASPTIVDVTLNGEMTNAFTYRVTVDNSVENIFNEPINPYLNTKDFTGSGTKPQVSAATAIDSGSVQVDFDEAMRDNAALVDKNNYSIGGYATISVNSVVRNSATRITLLVDQTMKTGELYTVTVSNVQDIAWNVIDVAHDSADFTGVGDHPKLLTPATPIDSNTVEIEFHREVLGNEAMDLENYSIVDESSNPLDLQKWWVFDGTDGLSCKSVVEDNYDPGGNLRTMVAVVELDENDSRTIFDKLDGTSNGFRLETSAAGNLKATYGNGSISTITLSSSPVPTGERVLVALRYDGTNLEAIQISSLGTESTSAIVSAAGNSATLFHIFIRSDLSMGLAGKGYWFGYFKSVLSDADLYDLYTKTDNPKDDSPYIYVDFHKDVGATYKPEVAPSLSLDWYFDTIGNPVKVGVEQVTGTTYRLSTEDQTTGEEYTITVLPSGTPYPSGIHDLVGNECIAPNNETTFFGVGVSPPIITVEPVNDARNVAVRNQLRVRIQDDPDDFTGIDESTPWIEVSHTSEDGTTYTKLFVKNGIIQASATGTKNGSGLDVDGIFYQLLPRIGRWEPNTTYTIRAFAQDIIGSSNLVQQSFRTGSSSCFEDVLPTQATLDTYILMELPGANIEKLRKLMLAACSKSKVLQVQARTLLHVATITELRTILTEVVNFGLVDAITLCDRQSILTIRQKILPYWKHVKPALDEIPGLTLNARRMLERYTESQSAVYAVNAIAAAIVLAAYHEGSA